MSVIYAYLERAIRAGNFKYWFLDTRKLANHATATRGT
jgi:hypothetical protein